MGPSVVMFSKALAETITISNYWLIIHLRHAKRNGFLNQCNEFLHIVNFEKLL